MGGGHPVLSLFGEMQPKLAVAVERVFRTARPHGHHAGRAARNLARGFAGLEDMAARPLGHAQKLRRQRWHQPVAHASDHRHPARNAVVSRTKADHAEARCRISEYRQGSERAGIGSDRTVGPRPGEGDSRLGRGHLTARGPGKGEDDRAAGDGGGEVLVVVLPGQIGRKLRRAAREALHVAQHRIGRGAVRFGEKDIKAYGHGARGKETVRQFRDEGAGPRPLTQLAQRSFVDIHHMNGGSGVAGAGGGALVAVKDRIAQRLYEGRCRDQQQCHGKRHGEAGQPDCQSRHIVPRVLLGAFHRASPCMARKNCPANGVRGGQSAVLDRPIGRLGVRRGGGRLCGLRGPGLRDRPSVPPC